jgi:L-rhamnose mutarotase
MPRFCYTYDLLPGTIEQYEREHAEIWPGVVAAMKRVGITEYSLFRRELTVTAWGECTGPIGETFAALDADAENRRWSAHIRRLMPDPLDEHGRLRLSAEIWRMD